MIRHYSGSEFKRIAQIFSSAIHQTASSVYSKEQLLAWSDVEPNYNYWQNRCELKRPFVYFSLELVVGFIELDTDGHIDCLYVDPDHVRRGIASLLLRHAIQTAFAMNINLIRVEASLLAQPLFSKFGFRIISKNPASIKGVPLENFQMELNHHVV